MKYDVRKHLPMALVIGLLLGFSNVGYAASNIAKNGSRHEAGHVAQCLAEPAD